MLIALLHRHHEGVAPIFARPNGRSNQPANPKPAAKRIIAKCFFDSSIAFVCRILVMMMPASTIELVAPFPNGQKIG